MKPIEFSPLFGARCVSEKPSLPLLPVMAMLIVLAKPLCKVALQFGQGHSLSIWHTSIHSASMSPSKRIHWWAFDLLLDMSLKVVLIKPSLHSRVDGCT